MVTVWLLQNQKTANPMVAYWKRNAEYSQRFVNRCQYKLDNDKNRHCCLYDMERVDDCTDAYDLLCSQEQFSSLNALTDSNHY